LSTRNVLRHGVVLTTSPHEYSLTVYDALEIYNATLNSMKFSKQRLSVCCSHEARLVTIRTLMVMLTATAGLMRSVMVASVIDEKKNVLPKIKNV